MEQGKIDAYHAKAKRVRVKFDDARIPTVRSVLTFASMSESAGRTCSLNPRTERSVRAGKESQKGVADSEGGRVQIHAGLSEIQMQVVSENALRSARGLALRPCC
eukprot:3938845-Rhodomonas_salina.6